MSISYENEENEGDLMTASELEHEWLRQKHGMGETNRSAVARASANLERAYRAHRIDRVTYEIEKSRIEDEISRVFDDGSTCSNGMRVRS